MYKITGTGPARFVKKLNSSSVSGTQFQFGYRGKEFINSLNNNFFFVTTSSGQKHLWKSNGTTAGTSIIGSFNNIGLFTLFKNKYYFPASNSSVGTELWSVDDAGNVVLIKDLNPGSQGGLEINPGYGEGKSIFATSDFLYFTGNNGKTGFEMWRTDGSQGNANLVMDLAPGIESSYAGNFAFFNNQIFFVALGRIWRTNGSLETTYFVFEPEYDLLFISALNATAEHLFFFTDYMHDCDMYKINKDNKVNLFKHIGPSVSNFFTFDGKFAFAVWSGDYYIGCYNITDGNTIEPLICDFGEYAYDPPILPFNNRYIFSPKDYPGYEQDQVKGSKEAVQYDYSLKKETYLKDMYPINQMGFSHADEFARVGDYLYFYVATNNDWTNPKYKWYRYLPQPAVNNSLKITSLKLVNANTGQDQATLSNNFTIGNANTLLKDLVLNIRAETSGPVESVKFILDGKEIIQNSSPYAYAGYSIGKYKQWIPSVGEHTLTVIPYSLDSAKGMEGEPYSISFSVQAKDKVISFTLVNPVTGQDIKTLQQGDTIGSATVLSKDNKYNIRANIDGQPYKVFFKHEHEFYLPEYNCSRFVDSVSRFSPPYTLAGYSNGKYNSFTPKIARHTITATPMVPTEGLGGEGRHLQVTFYVRGADAVTDLVLVNHNTNQSLKTINEGDVINIREYPGVSRFNIRANTNMHQVEEVVFENSGDRKNVIDRSSPFYYESYWSSWETLPINRYQMQATPYSVDVSTSAWWEFKNTFRAYQGKALKRNFLLIDEPLGNQIVDYYLLDADNDEFFRVLKHGDSLDLAKLPKNLNVQIVTYPVQVGSVKIEYNGNSRFEMEAPYSLFGDENGNFKPGTFTTGYHTLTTTPYSGANGTGTVGFGRTIRFYIYDSRACMATGTILREQWNDLSGMKVSNIPLETPPHSSSHITLFEGPVDHADRYGSRIRGYVCPPVSGLYTFWISCNDEGELWLSTDGNPMNKRRIAFVNGFTNYREWTKYPSQKSQQIYLEQNKKYYIEALHKEEFRSDHVSVGWQLPNGTMERPIPGNRLAPFDPSSGIVPNAYITKPYKDQIYNSGAEITIEGGACATSYINWEPVGSAITKIEFYVNSTKVYEKTGDNQHCLRTIYVWKSTGLGKQHIYAKAYTEEGRVGYSDTVTIHLFATVAEGCTASGTILREQWDNLSGMEVKDIPVHLPPNSTSQLTLFEGPVDHADRYGSRIRGYICPPQTGNYTFWISSNDNGELWLSTDDNPASKVRIAHISSFTNYREWNKMASQKSALIHLTAGKRYYIEALQKEEFRSDHLSVGWQLPDGTMERPIPGSRLSPFTTTGNQPPVVSITSPANNASFTAPANITITANASDADGSISKVEFYQGTTKLGEKLTSPYSFTWTNVQAGNYSLTAKAFDNGGTETTSEAVNIIVSGGTGNCAASGTILRELWTGISGNSVSQIPVHTTPTSTSQMNIFEGPTNEGTNYGARYRGYICAPVTGTYTFWISSNDDGELWLSTSDNPANKVKIASVVGFTGVRQWDKYSSQKSAAISLVAGQRYYIEALHKQGGGTDNFAVGWQLPNGTMERPVAGSRLSPFTSGGNQPPVVSITSPANNTNFIAPANITITANASDADGSISKVEFYQGNTKLGEKISSPYTFTWSGVGAGTYYLTAVAYDNQNAFTTSSVVTVTVGGGGGSSCTASGTILREFWNGVQGNSVSEIPTHLTPSGTSQINIFEGPTNIATNYGARYRGYICAPVSGNYVFWISSNDDGELWLSTNDNPANKVRIASVTGFTGIRQWDKYASQKSAPISLVAGQRYYIEALHKQGAGTDNFAVGWQLPNGALERPIPGSRLSPMENIQSTAYAKPIILSREAFEDTTENIKVKAFPNPTYKGMVTLSIEGYNRTKHKVYINVMDLNGKVIHSEKLSCDISCSRTIINIDERFSPGLYIINVTIDKKNYSERLKVE
ncbi:MAG: Ig-like domain-containing protein [Cytophagaceae bacterium]